MFVKLFFILMLSFVVLSLSSAKLNNRPIIGVLLQDAADNLTQYVASSYVKFIEMGGARVVPVFIKQNRAYYRKLLRQINGVLLPGGSASLLKSGYAKAADLILEFATSKSGTYFPIMAICLGFEKVITYFAGNTNLDWKSKCNVTNVALNLDFPTNLPPVKMFKYAGNIVDILTKDKVTANYHKVCLSVNTFESNTELKKHFTLISTNTYNGSHFVSTLEHKEYPIYLTQWHPEKNPFEWVVKKTVGNINHDWKAILVAQYFANFFVNESRLNKHHFASKEEEAETLIYNFADKLKYTGKSNESSFMEMYIFPIDNPLGKSGSILNQKTGKAQVTSKPSQPLPTPRQETDNPKGQSEPSQPFLATHQKIGIPLARTESSLLRKIIAFAIVAAIVIIVVVMTIGACIIYAKTRVNDQENSSVTGGSSSSGLKSQSSDSR